PVDTSKPSDCLLNHPILPILRTGRHDGCRSLYWRSVARLPTGHSSWPTRWGTCPIMVLEARGGRLVTPNGWTRLASLWRLLTRRRRWYRVDASPTALSVPEWWCWSPLNRRRPCRKLARSVWTWRSECFKHTEQMHPAGWYSASGCGATRCLRFSL